MRNKIDAVLGKTLVLIMSVMVINVLWQVFTRYVTGNPSSFTDELARYLMIWIGVLGAAYVSGRNLHVAIDILPLRQNEKTQKKLKIIVTILVILFVLFAFVIGGSRLVYISYVLGQQSPALQVPLALVYIIIPISGLLIMYYKISDLKNMKS
ncbi:MULTISPECIES: TRAP transporter small permease [Maribacter]|uniref:TRAP-type C4-dicarboxylate transport system, small permease component n=1 Tax=Maribacter dokdonensis TaxID=320912 RepID=A0ABY0UN96_9FLAO|nr:MULTISPECIES: TRAP transporter small permease [Maribacter]APA65133.1 C4-dicarboxylate ABC transporter permease [Maribacter sp. 1_2014MBL_MicDiv]KSA14709.1 TRAP-type C4-dicarboxylate transport system, small permease component [Maribacter dokdonensis DSW-8]CAG2531366.1 TRAP-type C4-dicarboxylate transport system [Maribacter dokdonensis]SDS94377.1 TRAP-type C4-dicarboxylate transport system, small permease component [Maribacter dokdonensis]|tara:strand:- start:171730 stop:172188 length:459 start_codon:yes stop_codon:yes gene_type:complete